MDTRYPPRRTGLGRRVADIVGGGDPLLDPEAQGGPAVLGGPVVVPLEMVPFPMLVADCAGQVLATNRRWADLSGLAPPASLGYGWTGVLGPADRYLIETEVERVAADGEATRIELGWEATSSTFGFTRSTWWIAPHAGAGERLVGIAVALDAPGAALRADRDPLAAEIPELLRSLDALMGTLDRLVAMLADRLAGREPVPV